MTNPKRTTKPRREGPSRSRRAVPATDAADVARDGTRERLVAAARDLVLESGPDRLSLREVARKVGVSAPAIYRHFNDKEALVAAAFAEGFVLFASYLVRALDEPTERQRLDALGRQYLAFGLAHPRDYRFIFMSTELTVPKEARKGGPQGDLAFRFLADRVAECMRKGILKEGAVEEVAATIWAHVHGLVSLRLAGHMHPVGDDPAFRAFYDRSVNALLRGLAP